jgi:hypothetical protein
MSRVFEWPDAHGPRNLHYARHGSSGMRGKVLEAGSDTMCLCFGPFRVHERVFAHFSLRRLSDRGYVHIACAIIKAGLGGDKTSPVHWGCCLGHLLNQRDGMDEFVLKAGIALGIENAA